jgi:hypothetical protein
MAFAYLKLVSDLIYSRLVFWGATPPLFLDIGAHFCFSFWGFEKESYSLRVAQASSNL